MLTTGPRGTNDILPGAEFGWRDSHRWQTVETAMRRTCERYAYTELRPPVFEHTELFEHGTGSTTDIVQREMYTFVDRGDRRVTLRPEFTPGLVRAYLEHKLHSQPQPTKLFAIGPCFRYERPQAGRFRQFHQWDVEVFGAQDPAVDAECIYMGLDLVQSLGLHGLSVDLNSIGCPNCRPVYRQRLQEHFRPHLGQLCRDCNERFGRNPLRLLDCKQDAAHPARAGAPAMVDNLCPDCRSHFEGVQRFLTRLDVPFRVNPALVRGLDYYTKTVFEVIYPDLGAQNTVWGGGRYDGLVETLGGKPTPGVGFALGIERLLLTLEKAGCTLPAAPRLDAFVVTVGDAAQAAAAELVYRLRRVGLSADLDYLGRSLKAQMKYAGKHNARFVAIIGDEELSRGTVQLKDMDGRTQAEVALDAVPARLGAES